LLKEKDASIQLQQDLRNAQQLHNELQQELQQRNAELQQQHNELQQQLQQQHNEILQHNELQQHNTELQQELQQQQQLQQQHLELQQQHNELQQELAKSQADRQASLLQCVVVVCCCTVLMHCVDAVCCCSVLLQCVVQCVVLSFSRDSRQARGSTFMISHMHSSTLHTSLQTRILTPYIPDCSQKSSGSEKQPHGPLP